MTFVLSSLVIVLSVSRAIAAKGPTTPDLDTPPVEETPVSDETEMRRQTVDLTQPPSGKIISVPHVEYFYPYHRALSLRAGQVFSSKIVNDTRTPAIGGIQFAFTTSHQLTYEGGADLLSDGTGALSFAKRWIYSRSALRPYLKLGGSVVINPQDRLVTFAKYENYRVAGAAGIECLIKAPMSARAEFEFTAGSQAVQGIATGAYVWAW